MSAQPQCPKCKAQIKDDYGMMPCPKCGTILFIDMDGIAHVSTDEPIPTESESPVEPPVVEAEAEPEAASEAPSAHHEPTSVTKTQNDADPAPAPVEDYGFAPIEFAPPEPMALPDPPPAGEHEQPAEEVPVYEEPAPEPPPAEAAAEGGDLDMDQLLGYQEPAPPAEPAEEFGAPGDPLGLNEYANSEVSQAKDGLLLFKILISGIDSKEMRDSLREALEDSRFGWNTTGLISKIHLGRLEIDRVPPVKAAILINRIKRLPIVIRWEQYAITQMDES